MADESRNPADNYEFRRLRSELQSVVDELKAEAKLAREQAGVRQREVGRQAREETAARRTRTAGRIERGASEPLPREEAAALRSSANDAERLARARERGLRAAKETTRAVERERLALPPGRQPLLLGPGIGGALGAPAAPYARPIPGTGGPVPPGGGGGGGGRIPPVLPPGPGGGGPGGFDENARRRAADATKAATAAEAGYTSSLRDTIRAGGAYDDSLRRHGALTTEFFSALARGEVTLSELRFQLGATIAKFAGWTAAATATFAVIGAIGQLGRGAIDASNGVTQLQRYIDGVDTGKAQQQFISLSRHFNLPIKDVSDAMAQMGQVFKTQDGAFRAAEAALYGVRTGNLDVADSVRFLNAIARSGGVQTADELVRIYDRINEAQNQLGVGIRDNLAGTASATGQWRAAGGSIEFLQTLITTGAARTGKTGQEMGTAFQRSAEIIKRGTAKNAEELKKFGIDATEPIDKIYRRAIQLVQTGKVKGADITRLGKALSTPNLSGRIAASFADPAYTARVEGILRKSRGSAEAELQTLKRSASEQVKQIGVNLQELGAEFVKAGGGHPFKEILASLNLALRVSTDLLQVFDGLPGPLKQAAIYGLELAALMKIGGKLGFSLPGRGTPETRANATREVEFHKDQVRRANDNLAQAQYNRDYHRERAAAGDEGAVDRLKAAETSVAEAEMRLKYATDRLTEATAMREAMLRGAPPPGGAGRGPVPPGGYPGGRTAPAFGAPGENARTTPLGVNLMPAAAAAEREAGRFRQVMGRVSGFTAGMFNSMSGIGGMAVRGYNRLGGIRTGLRNFLGSLRGLLSDPISMGFAAFTVGTILKDHFDKQGAHYDKIGNGPRSAAERDKLLNYRGDDEHDIYAQQVEQDILGRQQAERRAGKPVKSLFTSEIRHQAGQTMDALKAHKITRDEAYKQLDVLFTELKSSRSSPALISLANHDIKKLQQGLGPNHHQSLADILRNMDPKDFIAEMQADATVIQDYGRRPQRLKEINVGYRVALEAVKKNPTVENVKSFKAASAAVDAVISDSQQRLQDALAQAGTLRQRESAYDANARRIAKLPKGRARTRAQVQNEQARFTDELQTFDAYTDYRASSIKDPTARDKYVLGRMNARIARLRKAVAAGKAKETDLWQAESQRNAQLDQIQQDQEDAYQSGLELATARYALSVGGAAGPMARRAVSDAQKLVAHIQGRKHTQKELNDALKQLAQAQLAVQQYIRDQRGAMIQADQAYAAAGIDSSNPVAVARLAERFARKDRSKNPGQDPAARRQQDAAVRQTHADTIRARQQDRFDTIEFEVSIGKITRQQEISQLQTLLKTIHNNRALRRQIRQQIYQLRHAQDDTSLFDLNVGNIKLPTVYEIRRAMKGGAGPTRQQVQVQQTNKLNVTVSSKADVDEVFRAIDGYTGAGLQAAGRAAGVV